MNAQMFKLTEGERISPLWQKLEAFLKNELDMARKKNDAIQSEAETAQLRGRIAEIKRFLDLGKFESVTTPPIM